MALNKTLNATCDLNGYLFCRMPNNSLEVEVKIMTRWCKYTLFQDTYTQMEKYCFWDRADRGAKHTKQKENDTPKGGHE